MKTYIPATEADRRAALTRIEARRAALLLELEDLEAMQEGHRAALTGRPMLAQVEALPTLTGYTLADLARGVLRPYFLDSEGQPHTFPLACDSLTVTH